MNRDMGATAVFLLALPPSNAPSSRWSRSLLLALLSFRLRYRSSSLLRHIVKDGNFLPFWVQLKKSDFTPQSLCNLLSSSTALLNKDETPTKSRPLRLSLRLLLYFLSSLLNNGATPSILFNFPWAPFLKINFVFLLRFFRYFEKKRFEPVSDASDDLGIGKKKPKGEFWALVKPSEKRQGNPNLILPLLSPKQWCDSFHLI